MYRKLFFSKSIINRCTRSATSCAVKPKGNEIPSKSQEIIDREARFGAANYHPLPVVLQRGSGI